MTPLASLPDTSDTTESISDEDFDHIAEAKDALEDVVTSGRLDFSTAVEVAKTHALISIAQSLDALAFTDDDPEGWDNVFNLIAEKQPQPPIYPTTIAQMNDIVGLVG